MESDAHTSTPSSVTPVPANPSPGSPSLGSPSPGSPSPGSPSLGGRDAPGATDSDSVIGVVVAHGSRNDKANVAFIELCNQWAADSGHVLLPAFLEFASPSIEDRLSELASAHPAGGSIVVIPYFLLPGNHITVDIPRIVESIASQSGHMEIRVAPPIGEHPAFIAGARDAITSMLPGHSR